MSSSLDSSKWTEFLSVVAKLRAPGGCPWDREQTYESLTKFVLEESHELVAAAQGGEADKLKEELGDLLLEIALYCQIAVEKGDFGPDEVLDGIIGKLTRRHPHVFGDEHLETPEAVRERWDEIKRGEPGRYKKEHSLMDEVQKGLPALMTAQRQQVLAAGVGFDWDSAAPVFSKVREELDEIEDAVKKGISRDVAREAGDLLFACVNLARHLGVEAEPALLGAVEKFSRRFRQIENELASQDLRPRDVDLVYLDALWEKAKEREKP